MFLSSFCNRTLSDIRVDCSVTGLDTPSVAGRRLVSGLNFKHVSLHYAGVALRVRYRTTCWLKPVVLRALLSLRLGVP